MCDWLGATADQPSAKNAWLAGSPDLKPNLSLSAQCAAKTETSTMIKCAASKEFAGGKPQIHLLEEDSEKFKGK